MRVLIAGAGGKVARAVRRELAGHHQLRLMDVVEVEDPEGEVVVGSITDRDAVERAVAGMEAVVQLALSPDCGRAEGFQVSVTGTYVLLEAAAAAGAKRAVCTSSLSVYWGERRGVTEATPAPPGGAPYPMMKVFEESVARFFAEAEGLPAVVLRLTGPLTDVEWQERAAEVTLGGGVTHLRDVAQAYRLALEWAGESPFEIFHIGPEDPHGELPIDKAKKLLGYRPRWPVF